MSIMDTQSPPTPSPSPPSPPEMLVPQELTLPGHINAATRKQHTELNRLLTQRLPLALPPHTDTPLLFGRGIVPFAKIFMLFEHEWDRLTSTFLRNPQSFSDHDHEVRRWLVSLRPEGLARSDRLRNDLKHLHSVGGARIYETAELGDKWVEEIRGLVRRKPHVLVAFAWVFYMAVFSGGRWIRQQLANSGEVFWLRQCQNMSLEEEKDRSTQNFPGISFLSFSGAQDGEDIKILFKQRLADAECVLNEEEKQDAIAVSQQLFQRCIELVNELDQMVYWEKLLSWIWPILASTLLLATVVYFFIARVFF